MLACPCRIFRYFYIDIFSTRDFCCNSLIYCYRDRNTGIWDEVSISVTGVSLLPFQSEFPSSYSALLMYLVMHFLLSSDTNFQSNISYLYKLNFWLITILLQPVKIIDPHLVSSFFDNYKRVYLHATIELENRSTCVVECSLNIQVTTELEGNVCLVEHLQTQHLSIPARSRVKYTFPEVRERTYDAFLLS